MQYDVRVLINAQRIYTHHIITLFENYMYTIYDTGNLYGVMQSVFAVMSSWRALEWYIWIKTDKDQQYEMRIFWNLKVINEYAYLKKDST